jgi:hypothetical protein
LLGQPVPASGKVPHHCRHEIRSNVKERPEGIRIKHWLNGNALKMYDKGSVLRVESTLREPQDFKVYRAAEGDPQGPKDWRPLRKGVADLNRRGAVGQAANERYPEALSAVHDATPRQQLVEPLCRPALEPARRRRRAPAGGAEPNTSPPAAPAETTAAAAKTDAREVRPRRVRALNPLAAADAALLAAVSRQEFLIKGLRNRDLRRLLYPAHAVSAPEERRHSATVTRQLRLLRAHGLIHEVPKTHRYLVSEKGRLAITALLAARNASVEALTASAA